LIWIAREGPPEIILVPIVLLLVTLLEILIRGISKSELPAYVTPNEGIKRSVRNGLLILLLVGLSCGVLAGLSCYVIYGPSVRLLWAAVFGLIVGLLLGLPYGLSAAAQHATLRLLMRIQHLAPLRYVRWLDYAVHLRLLYRGADGGYMFIHRLVQDYFATAEINGRYGESSSRALIYRD